MKTKFLFLLSLVIFTSCDKNDDEVSKSSIIGNWEYAKENTLNDELYNQFPTLTYNRTAKIEAPTTGEKGPMQIMVLKKTNELVEKKRDVNTLKPLPDLKGFWVLEEKVLTLEKPTPAFTASEYKKTEVMNHSVNISFDVIELSDKILKIKKKKNHSVIYQRIENISKSLSCDGNMEDWAAVPIGHKPCGGPAHFLPYNKKMENLEEFLTLVKEYNELQKDSKKDSGMVSDCSAVTPPSKIECFKGKPLMIK